MKVSILIPTFNRQKYLKRCVESIQQHSGMSHEIIFINNGLTRRADNWLQSFIAQTPHACLMDAPGHFSYANRVNRGLQVSSGDYIVLLHNDVRVTAQWLCGMIDLLDAHGDAGLAGPLTNKADGIQAIVAPPYLPEDRIDSFAREFRSRNRHRRAFASKLSGVCVGFRRRQMEKIGKFDAQFNTHDVMIEDFCLRSRLAGFKNAIAADVFVYHADNHKSQNKQKSCSHAVAEDRKAYAQKWNYMDPRLPQGRKLYGLMTADKGIVLTQAGRINKALEIFSEAFTSAPQEPAIVLAMAEALMDAGDYRQALEVLNDNLPAGYQGVRSLEISGYCQFGLERFEAAENCAERLLSINPASASGLNLKGLVVSRQGDRKIAANIFLDALESDPSYGPAYTNLGILKQEAGQLQEALEFFESGFILAGADRKCAARYHSTISALNAFDRAEAVFREAVALYPKHKQLIYFLIDILLKVEKFQASMEFIKQAIVLFGIQDGILAAAAAIRNKVGPKEIDPANKQPTTVSLCMITKNEEDHLARCLWSADAIVDEIIVVDTGSMDRTKDIASIFGAKVYDFKWTHDFSAARNHSLAKACGDWILVLDADEVISESDHDDFRKIVSRAQSSPAAFEFVTRNYTHQVNNIGWKPNDGLYPKEEAGSGWTASEKVRLFPNSSAICFEYPIHELVEPSLKRKGLAVERCEIPIHHYGKLSPITASAKMKPYYRLGNKKLADLEGNAIAIRELAVQAAMLGNHHEAVDLWKRFIALLPDNSEGYLYLGTAYTQLGRYEDAAAASQKALELDPKREEARYNYGISQLYLGHAGRAIEALECILQQHPDYLPAEFMVSAAYCCAGEKKRGIQGFNRLKRSAIGRELSLRCLDLARSLLLRRMMDYAILLIEAAIEAKAVSSDARLLLTKCTQFKETAGRTSMFTASAG